MIAPADRRIALVLFIVASSVFFWTAAGITSTNDGSHYALIRAMGDEGRFIIDSFVEYTDFNDYAEYEGHYYSDRPPGTAVAALPFYFLGRFLPGPIAPAHLGIDAANPTIVTLLMLPAIAGGLVVAILYLLLRDNDISQRAAIITTLAYAFGSLAFKYNGVIFSHAVSALCVMGGVFLVLRGVKKERLSPGLGVITGFALGYSVVTEYSNAVFAAIALFYLVVCLRGALVGGKEAWWGLAALTLGGLLPLGFLLFYNAANFGSPFATSYTYAQTYEWAQSFSTTFDFPLWEGVRGQLWAGWDSSEHSLVQGIFLLTPVAFLALPGAWWYSRARWREAALTLGIFMVFLLLMARHRTFGGYTGDTRYLTPFISFIFIPIGYTLERLFTMKEEAVKAILVFIAFGLLFLSIRNMLLHIGYSYNYHLNLALLHRQASLPDDWRYMAGNIFVNGRNLPMLWLVEGVFGGLIAGIVWLRNRLAPQPPSAQKTAP